MKIGTMGHGMVVQMFLEEARKVEGVTCAAVYTRPGSREYGLRLANTFQVPVVHHDLEEFFRDDTIDTVYIALPNSLHYAYAKQALEAEKHVILEKPFTTTRRQAEHLAELARQRGLFLFEAITVPHLPNVQTARALLPRLGDISLIQCNYSQYSSRYDLLMDGQVTNMFDPQFGGGSLMDINSYNIHFVTALFGAPGSIHYYPRMGPSGVDTSGIAVLQYDHFVASCAGAKDSKSDCFAIIQGRNGSLVIPNTPSLSPEVILNLRGAEPERFNQQEPGLRMYYEIQTFQRILTEKDYPACHELLEHSILVSSLLEQARTHAGIHFPEDEAAKG